MTTMNIDLKNNKREKIKITTIDDFKKELEKVGYNINQSNESKFKSEISQTFNIDKREVDYLYESLNYGQITYKANNISNFIDYIKKIILFRQEHEKLSKKINKIKKLRIDRIEYDRQPSSQDNVDHIIKAIEEIKPNISSVITEEEKEKIKYLSTEIDKDYIYAKDIELLKKMIFTGKENIKEHYNNKTQVKTVTMNITKEIDYKYIKPIEGSIEYYKYISNSIPRMKRLAKSMDKYMELEDKEETIFKINQSSALQDSINIAIAVYNNKEFKAISGSNNIVDYCKSPSLEKQFFNSCKVNKLGKLGTGYNRVNDSEKKILEEIHKQIKSNDLNNKGELTLYSKWEPCPSCYFVISQFCKQYPDINVKVKYIKKYGEI